MCTGRNAEDLLSRSAKVTDLADRNLYLAEEKLHEKYLVLYRMDIAEMHKLMANTSEEERRKSMGKSEGWMKKNMASMADYGGPIGKTKRVAASGITDIRNDIGGYSIVQAESQEAAAALFADNPHLTMPGATAEVMEIMPMPGS